MLAGAFISLGALFYTVTITTGKSGPALPFGLLRVAGGVTFSLGLVLVVVGGAELFTGNNLIAMAWAVGCVQTRQVVRNWVWVYLGNLLGAGGTAVLVLLAGVQTLADGAVGETMVQIARSKIALDPVSAFARGILCALQSTEELATASISMAIPMRLTQLATHMGGIALAAGGSALLSVMGAVSNLVLVTLGNIIGGTVLVALVYWFVYLRTEPVS